jgi:chromosome segregation protein
MTVTAPIFATAKLGIVQTRQLILVQTLDIARLTAHPVRLIPETFVAVTGMGPVDSNESGKTSFLAVVALLLGDPEWRVGGNGAGAVASLLFEPVTAGITGASAATEGYVVGVFADPANITASACTVWMKISSGTPYIQVKHAPGIHLAPGSDDRERHSNANRVFRSLPSETWGGAEFAEKLYGRSPRVLAYVASRGQVRSRPSLLKLDAGTFTPDQIGDALIALTGRAALFERDEQDRQGLANKQAELQTHIDNDRKQTAREADILRQVEARDELRKQTSAALNMWNASLARAVVDTYTRAASATCLLSKANAAYEEPTEQVTTLTAQRDELHNLKALQEAFREYDGKLSEAKETHQRAIGVEGQLVGELNTVEGRLNNARQEAAGYDLNFDSPVAEAAREHETRTQAVGVARANLTATEDALAEANRARQEATHGQFGESGKVIRLLAEKGIPIQSLIAAVRLDPTYRHEWEARLAPWREALVIPRDHLAEALPVLHEHPGAILISEPDPAVPKDVVPDLPVGVVSAPNEAIAFLDALRRQRHAAEPVSHVHADRIGLRIIGGFQAPIVGLDDLIAYWDRQVILAEGYVQRRIDELEQAKNFAAVAAANATRAQAAEQCASLTRQQEELQQRLTIHRQQVMPPLSKAVHDADAERRVADTALARRTQLLNEANAKLLALNEELRSLTTEIDRYKAAIRPDDVILSAWGRGLDAALRQLGWPALSFDEDYDQIVGEADAPSASDEHPNVERRTNAALQQGAHDKLVEAIANFRVYPDSSAPPPSNVVEAAGNYVVSRESSGSASAEQLAVTLASIIEWLDDSAERDASARDEVNHARTTRRQTTEFVAEKCRELEYALVMTQGAIKQRASSALDRISNALNDLNRHSGGLGAALDYELIPPDSPDKKWVCQVVPRWRRNPEGPMLAYDNVTNTAQEKLFSIHLVLAALLAAPSPEGRVLILDELADSLGAEHRREVLDAIAEVAREHRIMILATCQDSILSEASPHCGQILYFHYPSKSEALNRPTRMFGVDRLGSRVELTAEALLEGRDLM